MARFSNEFWVGLLAAVGIALTAWAILRADDRPDGVRGTYVLYVTFPSAEGVYPDTPIRVAGVVIGSVDEVVLDGSRARLALMLQGDVSLPADSTAVLKSEGVLGDRFVRVEPGRSEVVLVDGQELRAGPEGLDVDAMSARAEEIAGDVAVITANLADLTGDVLTQARIQETLANAEALSGDLRAIAATNREDLEAISRNLREVSEILKKVAEGSEGRIDDELDAIRDITASLDRTVAHVEAVAAKVERGEGTVGRLLQDEATINTINGTLEEVRLAVGDARGMVSAASELRTDVYYRGSYYLGTHPTDPELDANPVSGLSRNILGLQVGRREDAWYLVEVVSHPIGSISYEDHTLPDFGTAYREYVVKPELRFSFMFARRYKDLVFRFGMKESSGGFGVDALLAGDRVQLSTDVYDFTYGSWPLAEFIPNVQVYGRVKPVRSLYLEAGLDNVVFGARHGMVTGFFGGGFTFNDEDLKYVLASVPLLQ